MRNREYRRNSGQGSTPSPLLFIVVVEVINRKASTITRDTLRQLIYADNLALVADSEAGLQERLVEWKTRTESKSREAWRCFGSGSNKYLDIRLDGKKLNQRDRFVYLAGAVCGDGSTETDTRRRIQAGASAWRKVQGVIADRHISRKLKGKVLSSCITPAHLHGLETMAMTEKQQEKLQVCENNWVRRFAGVKE